jgi:hypothetical protein
MPIKASNYIGENDMFRHAIMNYPDQIAGLSQIANITKNYQLTYLQLFIFLKDLILYKLRYTYLNFTEYVTDGIIGNK